MTSLTTHLARFRCRLSVVRTALLATTAVILAGCSDSTGPRDRTGFLLLERPQSTNGDTVDTRLSGALVLLLRDSAGRPLPGADILLRGRIPDGMSLFTEVLRFRNPEQPFAQWSRRWHSVRTDAEGVIRVEVMLGTVAGKIDLEMIGMTPEFQATDTISFMVHAGAPAALEIGPSDSAVYVGGSYQLRLRVVDRYGNARPEQPTTSAAHDTVTVTVTGRVTGERIGRATVHGVFGGLLDSAAVSVVPRGVIAATRSGLGDQRPDQLLQFELDGSALQVLGARSIERPSWSPSGALLTFVDHGGPDDIYGGRIRIRTATGTEYRLLTAQDEYDMVDAPRFDREEAWVYFAGFTSWPSIMRAPVSGGIAETVVARDPEGYGGFYDPAPSPDGRYVAYVAYANCCIVNGVRILDLVTGQTAQGPYLWNPRWIEESGTIIGYRELETPGFVEVRPDGSVVREIPFALYGASPFDVSPDGRWVVVSTDFATFWTRHLFLFDLETGVHLPLGYSADMGAPAWKP